MEDPWPPPLLFGHQALVRGWEYAPRDFWHCEASKIIREHVLPRQSMFTPPVDALWLLMTCLT